MSPGRMTVQAISPAIFLPGPAMPSTSPARIASRRWLCDGDQADSVVCGSSTSHQLRAHDLAVGPGVVLPADVAALHAASRR